MTNRIVGAIILAAIMLTANVSWAQFSDVTGSVYGSTGGSVYMTPPSGYGYEYSFTAPPPIVPIPVPKMDATSPSVYFGDSGLTYTYPGQGGGPAVVVPPVPLGQSQIYFGQNGGPDVIVTPDGRTHYMYPGGRK